MKQRQFKEQIRSSLKQTLFTKRQFNVDSDDHRNPSPPQQNTPEEKITQSTFRHFSDVYYMNDDEKIIGEGANGFVRRCYPISSQLSPLKRSLNKHKYAVKIFRTGDPEIVNTIRYTFQLHRQLNDLPFILKAYDLFINSQKEEAHFVMEYCEYQSLEYYMQGVVPERKVKLIAQELSLAIDTLHQRGISHRDIKPDNILIKMTDNSIDLKLIDFGVSKKFVNKTKSKSKARDMWTRTGTLFYQAPEIFKGGGYNEKIDIWSAGVILYQLLCGSLPFQFETVLETIEQICDPDYNVENSTYFENLNPLQQDLLKRLLKKNPEKRLSAKDFSLHPWLHSGFNKKQNKSFDDSDINDIKECVGIDFSQSHQLQFNQCYTMINTDHYHNQLNQIEEIDEQQEGLKKSWQNFYGNHVHIIPQSQQNSLRQFQFSVNQIQSDIGNSTELEQKVEQNNTQQMTDFNVMNGLQRTESVQFDYIE